MSTTQLQRITNHLLTDDIKSGLLSIPENLMSLRRLCYMPNTDIYDVELAVAKEPAFAAYILKLANSALYGAGKIPCENLISVIKRIGMHSVSQYGMTFAIKQCHEKLDVPSEIANLLRENWQMAWNLSQEATQLYTQHRLAGNKAAKKIDISDILMLGVLQHTGRLAVLSDFNKQNHLGVALHEEDMRKNADQLNIPLLSLLFKHIGLPDSYSQLFSRIPEKNQALNAIDYLFSAALLKVCCKSKTQSDVMEYNVLFATFSATEIVKLVDHLCYLEIIKMDDLNLELLQQ